LAMGQQHPQFLTAAKRSFGGIVGGA
jgi:hypothetical protein